MATPIPQNVARFSLSEIREATAGRVIGGAEQGQGAVGVATDSREELRGKAFLALKGERFDGHKFLLQAFKSGATVLIVQDTLETRQFVEQTSGAMAADGITPSVSVVCVSDTLLALGQLARLHRSRWPGKVVAVAGSAGKTTTRSVISALLMGELPDQVHSTLGNLNNRIGVPMVLLGLREKHQFAVVEVGTNQPGEVAKLTEMATPDVAVLTLIDLEHTEGLGDLDGVEREEFDIFSAFRAGGVAIGFGEDERVSRCVENSGADRRLTYGFSEARDLQILERKVRGPSDCEVTLQRDLGGQVRVGSPLVGRPGALALAAGVLCVETLLDVELEAAHIELALSLSGEPGRNTVIRLAGERIVIDDSYNSNPVSVENSLLTGHELCEACGGRLWLVLGEMLELGELSKEAHEAMGRMAAQSGAAGVFFLQGDAKFALAEAQKSPIISQFFESSKEVLGALLPLYEPGDVVVVKASRGVRAERVVEGLAAHFGVASYSPEPGLRTAPHKGSTQS